MSLFHSRDQAVAAPAPPSITEALGINPPKPTAEHLAGIEAAAAISRQQSESRLAQYESLRDARKKATEEIEDAVWKRVLNRQRNAIG